MKFTVSKIISLFFNKYFNTDEVPQEQKMVYQRGFDMALKMLENIENQDSTIFEFIGQKYPEVASIVENEYQANVLNYKKKLSFEYLDKGKIDFIIKEMVKVQSYLETVFALKILRNFDLSIREFLKMVQPFRTKNKIILKNLIWVLIKEIQEGENHIQNSQFEEFLINGIFEDEFTLTDNPNYDFEKILYKMYDNSDFNTPRFYLKLKYQEKYLSFLKSELDDLQEQIQIKHLNQNIQMVNEVHTVSKSNIFWKGNNKTEFVQFAYSLFYAELANDSNKEITKFVEELSRVFNYELGKSWSSNHSHTKKRNNDYKPELFNKLEKGYEKYINERESKKN